MDWGIFFTILGTGLSGFAFLYQVLRNLRKDMKEERKSLEDKIFETDKKIFQIALGKNLKDILTENYKKEK